MNQFRLIHSNALDVLAGVLAQRLRAPSSEDDWLRPETVLVPQFSMRRWLQQCIAAQIGICANVRFLTPGEFVDDALDRNLGPAPGPDRLRPETLRWRLLRELRADPPADYARFLGGGMTDDRARKRWSLACALADTFEKYQAWRRDLLLRWEAGTDPDDPQAQLWRRIATHRAHRARRIGDYLQRFGAQGQATPAGLPPRLFVFACQNVSPDVLQMIASQSRAGEQDFFLHTPSRAFWGDLERWGADYTPTGDDAFLGDAPNPLLAAWGRAGRDFIAALGGGDAVHARYEAQAFAAPPRTHLLGRLQADVLDNRAPPASLSAQEAWPRAEVDRLDPSLQFHACHTRLREVQVLHDQLRALLETPGASVLRQAQDERSEPRLDPRDIAVLAPDIDLYAPHIEAVFGGALGTLRELPYTIADTSPLASEPLADAFARLLDLPLRALILADALDLLAVPAIAARFGLDDGARTSLQAWLEAAGARRGFDGDDRARHDAIPALGAPVEPQHAHAKQEDNAYTFQFALDRLLLGYASGDFASGDLRRQATDARELIAGVAPWPALEGQSADVLDACLHFLAMLRETAHALVGPHAPQEWAVRLERLLVAAFGEEPRDPGDRRTLERLRGLVAAFAQGAADAGFADPVEHVVLRDQLLADLHDADPRAPFLSGGVCFGRMVPMRLIPFRVICLLGMDDGAFPARDAGDPLNRIVQALDTGARRVGDPSRRDADRYLFLQLFASAGRVFYLSWLGFDAGDGSAREPASVVAELLDVAARYHAGDAADSKHALVVRHALQPFSPAAFGAAHVDESDRDPRRFSFDARWHGASGRGLATTDAPAFASAVPWREVTVPEVVTLDRLRSALARPQAFYLHDGLGLRLPEEEPALAAYEPFGAPDALAHHALRQQVFEEWLRTGHAPALPSLHARLLAQAQLAPGADGRATLAALIDEVAPFAQVAWSAGFGGEGERRPFAFDLDGIQLVGSLPGVYPQGLLRTALNAGGLHGGHVLRHRLDALVASLLGLPVQQLWVADKGEPPCIAPLELPTPETARAALHSLLALRRTMLRAPLPFLPKSGYALYRSDDIARGMQAARTQWLGGDYLHAEADAATRLALRGCDPFEDRDADAQRRFAEWSRRIFAALEHARAFDAEAPA